MLTVNKNRMQLFAGHFRSKFKLIQLNSIVCLFLFLNMPLFLFDACNTPKSWNRSNKGKSCEKSEMLKKNPVLNLPEINTLINSS